MSIEAWVFMGAMASLLVTMAVASLPAGWWTELRLRIARRLPR